MKNRSLLLLASSVFVSMLAAPVAANNGMDDKNGKVRGQNSKTVTTSNNKKTVVLEEWVDMSFSAALSEDKTETAKKGQKTVNDQSNAANTNWQDVVITTRANADHIIDIQFSCATLDGNIVPVFHAAESEILTEADLILGSMTVSLTTDNGDDVDVVLASLVGDPLSYNEALGSVDNKNTDDVSGDTAGPSSAVDVEVVCDDTGHGVMLLKVDYQQTQTNTYTVTGEMHADDGAALVDSSFVVTAVTGEAPAGTYEMDLNVGAEISATDAKDTSAYMKGNGTAKKSK